LWENETPKEREDVVVVNKSRHRRVGARQAPARAPEARICKDSTKRDYLMSDTG